MKKAISLILFVIMCLILISSLVFCIYSICAISETYKELANTPGTSGVDYLGIGWEMIFLFPFAVAGVIISFISKKLQQHKVLKNFSLAAIFIFVLLIIVSIIFFYA